MTDAAETQTWPDLAIGLYDRLTDRNAEIAYSFDQLEIAVPSSTKSGSESAHWRLNGSVRVSTRSAAQS